MGDKNLRNILIAWEIMPPSIMVQEDVSFHWGGERSCWESCRGSQKCHPGCHWQSLIVQRPFSGTWIQAVHTKCQSSTQQPSISLSRNWKDTGKKYNWIWSSGDKAVRKRNFLQCGGHFQAETPSWAESILPFQGQRIFFTSPRCS